MSSPVWHPFTQHGLEEPIPRIVRTGGALLHGADGRCWIDAISSWWVTTHGHAHPRIVAAIRNEAERMDQIIFAGWTHQAAEDVARALVDLLPDPLAHVFFSDSGSTSVEVAIKMALGFWRAAGETRHRILVLEGSYHGDTIGAMSVGARGVFNQAYAPLLFDVGTLPFPVGDGEATVWALRASLAADPRPAALIVEPLLLGAGGMRLYAPAVLAELRRLCADAGVPFIADEVMTGWGRTGTLLACEQAGVVPDILCLSKGLTGGSLPLAVTVATRPIYDAHFSRDRADMFYHSSSYTANPIACAAARANLAIWAEEPVLERVAALSAMQAERIEALAAHPALTGHRRLGTVTAMEVRTADQGYLSALAPRLTAFFREAGVLLRPLGDTLYVMPPYCTAAAQLDQVYGAIANAADRISAGTTP